MFSIFGQRRHAYVVTYRDPWPLRNMRKANGNIDVVFCLQRGGKLVQTLSGIPWPVFGLEMGTSWDGNERALGMGTCAECQRRHRTIASQPCRLCRGFDW